MRQVDCARCGGSQAVLGLFVAALEANSGT